MFFLLVRGVSDYIKNDQHGAFYGMATLRYKALKKGTLGDRCQCKEEAFLRI